MTFAEPHPHDLRVRARTAQYSNQLVEQETIKKIDRLVFDKVREYEAELTASAEKFLEGNEVDMTAADLVETQLRRDVRFVLEEGAAPTAELAAQYEALRRHAETAIRSLEEAANAAEWWAERASDPYRTYSALMDRYTLIRPRFDIQL